MKEQETVEVACLIRHRTDKAILIDDGIKEYWLPLSQVEIHEDGGKGVIVEIPLWLARKNNL